MKKRLYVNTFLLTGANVLMRFIAMAFQAWLAHRIGAAGIGLFQLVSSVGGLCSTLAISGVRFAATRLVAEELGLSRPGGVGGAMRRCAAYSLCCSLAACALLFTLAERIGFLWIGDARTVLSLRILALGLPFISLSSVISGYFVACGRIWKSSLVHLLEQLACVALVAFFLGKAPSGDIEKSCAAVTAGVTASDILSFFMMLFAYLGDRRGHGGQSGEAPRLTRRILSVAVPLAVAAYARSALSTLEHILVPRGLKLSGMGADDALAGYGVIQGMAMPTVGFPACLMLAVAELIVPELTEAQMKRDGGRIRSTVRSLLSKSAAFAVLCSAVLYIFAPDLGYLIFKSAQAGRYIRLLAPLVPVMYTDTVVDGCLKGLGQQVWSMAINILDAAVGAALVWALLPVGALRAYIGIIYFTEILNFALSAARLRRCLTETG